MGSLLDKARRDSKKYITRGGFQQEIVLTNQSDSISVSITGLFSKHWLNFNASGESINSKNAHFTVDEDALVALNYPVRNADNEVHLLGHKISTSDSTGVVKNYVIKEWYPDETLGLIVCLLSDYEFD